MVLSASNIVISGAHPSPSAKNPIAELKHGKVIFRQKPITLEKASETMQEIVKFREMLDSRVQNQGEPLISVPDEHKPLIAKLAQESDKGALHLAKHIRSILLPGPGDVEDAYRLSLESILPLPIVEHTIKSVMIRTNYGLDGPSGQKIPAALCIWRWEVQESFKDWLPKSSRDNAEARLAERIQARTDLRAAFQNLSQAERNAILDPKGAAKPLAKDVNKSETDTISACNDDFSATDYALNEVPTGAVDGAEQPDNLVHKGRMKKAPDPEKVAKIKDKEEKRAARAEKEKKQKEAQDRSRSIMVNFFGKPKPSARDSPTKDISANLSMDNDFQRTFKPFLLKKDAELAPFNWFLAERKKICSRMTGGTHEEAIIVDDDRPLQGVSDSGPLSDEPAASTSIADNSPASLQDIIQGLCQSNPNFCPIGRKVSSPKTYSSRSVRDTISQLNDAEIAGDPVQVRRLLSVLRDRRLFPAKIFIFHDDSRPGYHGTWTRNSRIVGPRTPLDRDVSAHDYTYDSGEEWEDEGPGDADDVADEDDEPDAEDVDSDLDSWLVDDDDERQSPLHLDELSPPLLDLSIPPPKRKAENNEKRSEKKRKAVVPLVPYAKGPSWESHIGQCQYDPFDVYRIQLLNDTPCPIDPFTFVSVALEKKQDFEIHPPFPGTLHPAAVAPSAPKRTVISAPKTSFPEAHLDALLTKVTELASPSLTLLVESIYQDFRAYKIKKNAIEAKVREISEKSKDKIWVVKQGV